MTQSNQHFKECIEDWAKRTRLRWRKCTDCTGRGRAELASSICITYLTAPCRQKKKMLFLFFSELAAITYTNEMQLVLDSPEIWSE
jgi:hypothetical protein